MQGLSELFDARDWSRKPLEEMHRTIVWLEKVAPSEGAKARRQLAERFEDFVDTVPRIAPYEAQIKEALDWLSSRDPDLEDQLFAAFNRQLARWEEIFNLAAPFRDPKPEAVFGAGKVKVNGATLLAVHESTEGNVVYTRVNSAGPVSMEVVLDESWEQASQIALLLNATRTKLTSADENATSVRDYEYRFVIRTQPRRRVPDEEGNESPQPLSAVRQVNGRFLLEIFRDQACLQRKTVDAANLPSGPLGIKATKKGEQLEFEVGKPLKMQGRWRLAVGNVEPAEFRDPFAFQGGESGVFAIQWPAGVAVLQLRGLRQAKPERASLLQEGDHRFARREFATALAFYRHQAQTADEVDTKQAARYKMAMCLLALKREAEAEETLAGVARERGDRWPALAACQLWVRWVRQRRFAEADLLYMSLAGAYRPEQVASMIPSEVRDEILNAYVSQIKSLNLYRADYDAVRACERAVSIAKLFRDSSWLTSSGQLESRLIRAHRKSGQEAKALEVAGEMLRDTRSGKWSDVLLEYCWMLRVAGRHEEALQRIDDWTKAAEQRSVPHEVILERVRVLAALGRWDEAEKEVDKVLRVVTPENPGWCYTSAWALLGFLRERRGDVSGAQQAWKEGLQVDWRTPWYGFRMIEGLILASLSGELTKSDTEILAKRLMVSILGGAGEIAPIQFLIREELEFATSVLGNVFQTTRGREYARKIVFRELTFADCIRVPPMLVADEAIRALREDTSDEEEALIWRFVDDSYIAMTQMRGVDKRQLLYLASTWKGITGHFGWQDVTPTLESKVRGPIAYVMGHRYLHHLKRPGEAVMFFQTALKDARPESPLEKLAQAELDRLAPKANKSSSRNSVSP